MSGPMRSRRVRVVRFAMGWATALLLVAGWQLWTSVSESLYFPTPWDVLVGAKDQWWLTDGFARDIAPSLLRLAAGLLIAWSVGICLGVVLGRVRVMAELIEPLLHFMRALPGPVLLPLALLLVGTGTSMRVGLIAFGAVWPVLFNTYSSVRRVPVGYLEAARVSRLGRVAMLFRVVLPAAGTGIFAGVRVSTALGVVLLIASELVAASDGIGFGLAQSQRSFQFLTMWTFILVLSALGYLSNILLSAVERVLLRWHHLRMAVTE